VSGQKDRGDAPSRVPPAAQRPEIVAWVARCRLGKGLAYALDPGCRPGERIVAGSVYVYDLDALNSYLACEAVLNAPDDLSALTEDEVRSLRNRCGRVWAMEKGKPGVWDDLAMRCSAELSRRAS